MGFTSVSILPSYKNSYEKLSNTYFVDRQDDFVAEIMVGNGLPEAREVAIVCLLDHVQFPCVPNFPRKLIVTVPGQELRFLPLRIGKLQSGLHDLDILAVRGPFIDDLGPTGESIRYSTLAVVSTNNILVDGLNFSPVLAPLNPAPAGKLERASILDVSPNEELTDEFGNIPLWIETEGGADETLAFYLHFNSGVHDEDGDVIAVAAFLNYEQVPLYYDGNGYQPLYIEREAASWQRLQVHIRLPEKPGAYELLLVARTDAFSPLEIAGTDDDVVGTEESKRIKITVH